LRIATLVVCSIGLLVYPLLVYNFASTDRPLLLVTTLAILGALRLFAAGPVSKPKLVIALILLCTFCALALLDTQLRLLRLYPVLISLGGAGFCWYTLAYPPSAIERFARRVGMAIPTQAIGYLRGVTLLWLGFFCLNATVAGYTAVATDVAIWALYNGLISYLIIGMLLLGEWLYRPHYQRKQNERQHNP
jgi:uncharacterized membrane protein